MAFFYYYSFLCSFCMVTALAGAVSAIAAEPSEPDRILAQMILEQPENPHGKIRLLYGHGAKIPRKLPEIHSLWQKGAYGEPYFIPLKPDTPDETLYKTVKTAAGRTSVPAMRIQAFMLWHGRGVQTNLSYAVQLWQLAAKAGDETATGLLAILHGTAEQRTFANRYNRLKKNRLKQNYGKQLYIPQLFCTPPDKNIKTLSLKDGETVAAFLIRAIRTWQDGSEVCILLNSIRQD
ncbi:MAG: sel1 repeat family protein [Lentisphaeria bacterium]|nr:sel1 repeat family protein [Lentisphaeria bacterium]